MSNYYPYDITNRDFTKLYACFDGNTYYKLDHVLNIDVRDIDFFNITFKPNLNAVICKSDLFTKTGPKLQTLDENTINKLLRENKLSIFKDNVDLVSPVKSTDFDKTSSDLFCVNGDNTYIFHHVNSITVDTAVIIITFDDSSISNINKKNIFISSKFSPLSAKTDNLFVPDFKLNKGMPFKYSEYKPDQDILVVDPIGDGTLEVANIEQDPSDTNNYIIVYVNPNTGQVVRNLYPKNTVNNLIMIQKKQTSRTLTVFTPFDYNHYQSYKSMYSIYILINSNILFEIPNFDSKEDLDTFTVQYKPVAFIQTDKFLGYLPDYEFDTRNNVTGYYYKDYDYITDVTKAKASAEAKYKAKQLAVTQAAQDVRDKYNKYYDLKKELQTAISNLTKADNKYRDAQYDFESLPPGTNHQERERLNRLQAQAKQEQDDAKNNFDTVKQELDDAKNDIQASIQDKKNVEGDLINSVSLDEINIKNITKKVSRNHIFLVNKKYLKQNTTTEYIVIDYKSKYKINPFIDKNITNFDSNMYELYKKHPESCKIFFQNYIYPTSFIGKNLVDYIPIRIINIELVSKTEKSINSVVIKNLEAKLPDSLAEYPTVFFKYNVEPALRSQDAGKNYTVLLDKVTSIYTKLIEFEGDFKKSIKYWDDEDKFYKKVYKDITPKRTDPIPAVLAPNTLTPNDFDYWVKQVENLSNTTEQSQTNVLKNTDSTTYNTIKDRKIVLVGIINNPGSTPQEKSDAQTELNTLSIQEKGFNDVYYFNSRLIPYINGVIDNYIDYNIPPFNISFLFYKIVSKMSKFITDKYTYFLTQAIELREQGINIENESIYFFNESQNDINNKKLYEDIATKKYYQSQQKSDEADQLFDRLNGAQDELNQIYAICKISVNLLYNNIINANINSGDETMIIYLNLLENLGIIRETQGLISEKLEEILEEALKFYQMAQIEYTYAVTKWNNAYTNNDKLFVNLLYSYNDKARNYCNISRILKKLGYIQTSNTLLTNARTNFIDNIYNKISLNPKNMLASNDVPQFYYDYAMFLISQNNLGGATKFLMKADDAIKSKTTGNVVKSYIDKLLSGTMFEGYVDKEMGPYNLLAMNIKRELDYILKTTTPDKYFYLFGNKQTTYTIEYFMPGANYDKSNSKKEVSSKFLFLQYSQQNNYAEDKTFPTQVRKLSIKTSKKMDDKLYDAYTKNPLSYFIVYNDQSEPDNFLTTVILQVPSVITKPLLTASLLKPVMYGGGKTYQIVYLDDFGNIETKNIDESLLSIIQIKPEESKILNAISNVGLEMGGNLLKYLWSKATILKSNPSKLGANKIDYQAPVKKTEIVPNELKIELNTSIPGFQKIQYTPKMTLRDTNDTTIRFDPLTKLDLSVINSVPKDLRIKQFFNKGLFESLINFHGMEKVRTLLEAMQEGIVNNNIQVTLRVLFGINTPIYINGETYYIADVQWTPGDWTVDVKQKPVTFDMSKITNPYVYSSLVNDDIISGQQQINSLPKNLLTGPNYKGPPPQKYSVARGLSPLTGGPGLGLGLGSPYNNLRPYQNINPYQNFRPTQTVIPVNSTQPPATNVTSTTTGLLPASPTPASNVTSTTAGLLPAPPTPATNVTATNVTGLLPPAPPVQGLLPTTTSVGSPNMITGGPTAAAITGRTPVASGLSSTIPKPQDILSDLASKKSVTVPSSGPRTPFSPPRIDFDKGGSKINTKFFRDIFAQVGPSFYANFATLFTEMTSMPDNQVETSVTDIKQIQRSITDITISAQGLSQSAYNQTVGGTIGGTNYGSIGLRVSSPENLFITVAKAINQYNYNSQQLNNQLGVSENLIIIKGRGGSGDLEITPEILKQVLIDYLQSHNAILGNLIVNAQNVSAALNLDFNNQFTRNIDEYMARSSGAVMVETEVNPATGTFDPNYVSLYNTTVDSIFKNNYTFGLIKPKKLEDMTPAEMANRLSPFTSVNNNAESIRQYILSDNYLLPGDEVIQALNIVSKLGIIVVSKKIENINPGDARPSGLINIDNNIFYDVNETNGLNYGKWNKVLFLCKETTIGSPFKDYYGIITFSYKLKPNIPGAKSSIFVFTIFNKNSIQFSPPLYILYTVFYLKYLDTGRYNRDNFVFYTQIMVGFYLAFISLLDKPASSTKWTYFDNAYTWFKTTALRDIITSRGYDTAAGFIKGGASKYYNKYNKYNNNYNNYNNYNRYPASNSFLKTPDLSKIGYYISVELELKKGSPLTPEELNQSKCVQKWNTVRKSFSNFTGRKYTIPPVYDYSNKKTVKNQPTDNKLNNVTRKNVPNVSTYVKLNNKMGGTRKQQDDKKIYLGKHNKTIRHE